jgi:hypothetical protein
VILPLFYAGLLVTYLVRSFISSFIFTEEFIPKTELFKWQLLEIYLAASIVVGYQLLQKTT